MGLYNEKKTNTMKNIKIILIFLFLLGFYFILKDWIRQNNEIKRLNSNFENQLKLDSLKYAKLELNRKEIEQYFDFQRQDLKKVLDENKIKVKQIESIISQTYKYKDTTINVVDLQPILDAVKSKKSVKVPFKDVSDCLTITGYTEFDNDSLRTVISERKFENQTDVIGYWKRKWFLGRKIPTVKVLDRCGGSRIIEIKKIKKLK